MCVCFLYANEMPLGGPLDNFRIGDGCQRNQTKAGFEGWDFQPHLTSREGRGIGVELIANDQLFNQPCLCDGISIKKPNKQGSESFWIEYFEVLIG